MHSKLLASLGALALAATIAACSDAPTAPSGKPSLDLLPPPPPPCVLVGQPVANQTIKEARDLFIFDLTTLVNENRLNCGQANSLLVHVESGLTDLLNGRCQVGANKFAAAAHQIDELVEEEVLTDVEAQQLKADLRAIFGAVQAAGLCPDVGINF